MASNLKDKVELFLSRYLSDEGQKIECLTEFYSFNIDLIEQEKANIYSFFNKNFKIRFGEMNVAEFLIDSNGNVWNELTCMRDLDILDKLIGLAIASRLILDSYGERYYSFENIGEYGMFLNKEKFDITPDWEEIYFTTLRENVLPYYTFILDRKAISLKNEIKEIEKSAVNRLEYVKQKIINWMTDAGLEITDNDRELLDKFLGFDYEDFTNAFALCFDHTKPRWFLAALRTDMLAECMNIARQTVSKYTREELDDLDAFKDRVFENLGNEHGKKLNNKKPTQ